MLTKPTLDHFKLKRDSFTNITSASEIYLSAAHASISEFMRAIIMVTGLAAVYGPVGSGKTTMLRKLIRELREEGAYHIAIVESLNKATLKRLWDKTHDFEHLISIVLVGQEELYDNIFVKNSKSLRELACRTTPMEMTALPPEDVHRYLSKRASSAGANINKLITPEAIDALTSKINITDGHNSYAMTFPIFLDNAMHKLLNECQKAKLPIITPEVVKMVSLRSA